MEKKLLVNQKQQMKRLIQNMEPKIKNNYKPIISFINDILVLEIWQNENSPIFYGKSFDDYFDNYKVYQQMKENENLSLLMETIEFYSNALEDDWLPKKIVNLDIANAYLFLNKIKDILLNSDENEIEKNLISTYHEIKKDSECIY